MLCAALWGAGLSSDEAPCRQARRRRRSGDLSKVGAGQVLDMVGGVVKIVEVYLLFIDARFKKLHAGAVTVPPAL